MSPGPNSCDVHDLLAREPEQLADPLLDVRAGVQHLAVGAHRPLVDAQQVDPPRERVGAGLEDVREQLRVLGRRSSTSPTLSAPCLTGRGQVLDDRVQQARGAEVARRHAAHHREDLAVVGALLQRPHDLLVGDLLALQVALHQRVGDFRRPRPSASRGTPRACCSCSVGDRDLAPPRRWPGTPGGLGRGGVADPVLAEGLHVDQVDHALAARARSRSGSRSRPRGARTPP